MSNGITDAHLQVECEQFAFIAATNTLNPGRNDCFGAFTLHIHNQKEQAILRDSNALAKILTFECVMHEKFIVCTLQTTLKNAKIDDDVKNYKYLAYYISEFTVILTSVKLVK